MAGIRLALQRDHHVLDIPQPTDRTPRQGGAPLGPVTTDQLSTFFGLLALVALGVGVASFGVAIAASGRARVLELQPLFLPLALAIAATATLGSLYYSESANFTPCLYCWYQRICMYPLVPITAVALVRRDRGWGLTTLPLSVVGLGIAVYHYQLQLFPDQGNSCDASAPCTAQWVDTFGFISIPFMAACGFLAITGLAVMSLRCRGASPGVPRSADTHESLRSEVTS